MLFRVEVSTSGRKSSNQSAMAAYRAGERLTDQHGETFSYLRRTAVMENWLTMPEGAPDWDRQRLWQEVGSAEKRKDSVLCREVLVTLPVELSPQERKRLVQEHAQWLADRYQTAVDVALHKPTRRQDPRSFHAHLLMPTRVLTSAGLGRKLVELDLHKGGRKHVHAIREHVASVTNEAFERSNRPERVDPRSKRRQQLARSRKMTTDERVNWQEKFKEIAEKVRERADPEYRKAAAEDRLEQLDRKANDLAYERQPLPTPAADRNVQDRVKQVLDREQVRKAIDTIREKAKGKYQDKGLER